MNKPRWTVTYNIVSPEHSGWIGTGWEFFDDESAADACAKRHDAAGNVATRRPYFDKQDRQHLGAAHKFWLDRNQPLHDVEPQPQPEPEPCYFCGKPLNNVSPGIVIMRASDRTVDACGNCCERAKKAGWQEIARAR